MDTKTDFAFGDGTYTFWLPLPQVIELQRRCALIDAEGRAHPKSILVIFEQINEAMGPDGEGSALWLGGGSVLPQEANEVLRLGLLGGNSGMVDGEEIPVGPQLAKQLVDNYGYPARPLSEVMAHAWRVLHAAIVGIDVKKKAAPKQGKSRSRSTKAQ